MNEYERSYYYKMLAKDRLVKLKHKEVSCGILTYYIGNGNISKYVRDDSWSVIDDEPATGNTIYIDQLLAHNTEYTRKHSLEIWHWLKRYFKMKHPNAVKYRWNRFINGKVYVRQGRL